MTTKLFDSELDPSMVYTQVFLFTRNLRCQDDFIKFIDHKTQSRASLKAKKIKNIQLISTMKLMIAIGFLTLATADGALSTMRVGPRKATIRGKDTFEFGRPVDGIDVHAAYQEMRNMHMRLLMGGGASNDAGASLPFPGMSIPDPGMSLPFPGMSFPNPGMSLPNPGMSFPNPGMSLPNPGMSLPNPGMSLPNPGMSLPNPGMSLPNPGMSLPYVGSQSPTKTVSPSMTPTGFDTFSDEAAIHCVDRDSTTTTQIHIQLDVDTLNNGKTLFLQDLATSIVSFGQVHFALCHQSLSDNKRLLLEPKSLPEQENVTVTGLDATASSSGVCTSAEPGASCTVVDLILTVYSATNASSAAAEQQVYDQVLVKPMEAGTYIKDDILAIRFHPTQDVPADSSAVIRDGNPQTLTDGNQDSSSMLQTILIPVMILVGVAMLVVGLVLYRKRNANQMESSSRDSSCGDDSKSDTSSNVGDHAAVSVMPRMATEDSPHCV
ncbi:hypothetical protein MHU86_6621 [Fragilaria crotonensis]|nr:hypothetical protein MHU86_6621 [Fragilaria crotonensis]